MDTSQEASTIVELGCLSTLINLVPNESVLDQSEFQWFAFRETTTTSNLSHMVSCATNQTHLVVVDAPRVRSFRLV